MRRRLPTTVVASAADMGSLGRGLDILRTLGTHGVVTVADVAAQPGSSRGTAQRLLHTLASEGFLSVIPDRADEGAYGPDLACLTLGTALLSSFSELWQRQPVLQDIARRFGVEVIVATCDGAQTLVIEHASVSPAQRASLVGSVAPVESTAWGRCLVWMHSPAEQAALIEGIRRGLGTRAAAPIGALYQAFQGLEENGRCTFDVDERSIAIGMPVTASANAPLLAIGCVASRALLGDPGKAEVFWAQLSSLTRLIKPPATQDTGKSGG